MGQFLIEVFEGTPIIRAMMLFTSTSLILPMLGIVSASCTVGSPQEKVDADDQKTFFEESCIKALEAQVRIEFEASLQYILMAAHFDQDSVSLPNVAKLFWTHADEERAHAIEFIKYLRMRGAENNDFFGDSPITPIMNTYDWQGVAEALQMALSMEKNVTARMKLMIDICSESGIEDHHAGDWLAGDWMEEQVQGQRQLAGLINTLNNFKRGHEGLAEWMFDQEL